MIARGIDWPWAAGVLLALVALYVAFAGAVAFVVVAIDLGSVSEAANEFGRLF